MKILVFFLFPLLASAKIEVQGHRGARAVLPENTLAAMDYALAIGVDTLELDLAVTKDNILVLSHDPVLNKTLCRGPKGKKLTKDIVIYNLTSKELQSYNCAGIKNPRFPKQVADKSQKIPSLREVFDLVKYSKHKAAKKVKFNVETKIVPNLPEISPKPKAFAQLIVELAKEYKWQSRVIIQSFDYRSLKAAKKIAPHIKVAALTGEIYPVELVKMLQAIPADIWSPNLKWLNKTMVKKVQNAGMKVIPWTANTKEEWHALIDKGVDGIITDDPKELMLFLKRK